MRAFVAIALPPEIRAAICNASLPLRGALGSEVVWTREESLHITLKFLGEIDAHVVESLCSTLRHAVGTRPAPHLRFGGVASFPEAGRPRVIWVGVRANSALAELYQLIDVACAVGRLGGVRHPFRPHVTVGRVRPRARLDPSVFSRFAEDDRDVAEFRPGAVALVRSELTSAGACHHVLAEIPFQS